MTGTQLDSILRNLGATTIVGVGVSVNIGMTNFAFDAVEPRLSDGHATRRDRRRPADYAAAVIENTLSLVATITTTDEILAVGVVVTRRPRSRPRR